MLWVSPEGPRWGQTHARSVAPRAFSLAFVHHSAWGRLVLRAPRHGWWDRHCARSFERGLRDHGV